jgi:hypothetical protein
MTRIAAATINKPQTLTHPAVRGVSNHFASTVEPKLQACRRSMLNLQGKRMLTVWEDLLFYQLDNL